VTDTSQGWPTTNGQPPPPTGPITEEIGTTGAPIFAGRVSDEFLPQLLGDKARLVWREMSDNGAIIGSFLYGIEQQIRSVSWHWAPAEGDKSTEYADWFQGAIDDMSQSWPDTVSGFMSHLPYGWAYSETVFKRRLGPDQRDPTKRSKYDDGKLGWRKLALRNQETRLYWEMDDEGGVQGMWQLAPPRYQLKYIPIERALLFRTTVARGNPEGRSILRNAFEAFFMEKHIRRLEAIGLQRDLTGLPMVYAPMGWFNPRASDDQRNALAGLLKWVTAVVRDEAEGVVMPTDYDEHGNQLVKFELVSSPGTRPLDIDAAISRYNQQQAMTVLADFILVGHEQVGSYNAAESKVDIFKLALQARAEAMASVISQHGATRLMGLNGWDKARTPKLVAGQIVKPDMGVMGPFLTALAHTGMQLWSADPATDALRKHILSSYGLPTDAPFDLTGKPIVVHTDDESAPTDPQNPGGEHPDGARPSTTDVTEAGASGGDPGLGPRPAATAKPVDDPGSRRAA
jgi:hypothetical protein